LFDHGLILTAEAIRRQLAAMPHEIYLIRLIHQPTQRPFPGERLWTAQQLLHLATIRFLRARNCEGCDIYVQPYAQDHNAGYILVDLDRAQPTVLAAMSAQGHEPCVVLQTSPGHLQAWVHVSQTPVPPALASALGRQLASLYGGDPASTDWRHLGRLAGFTNRKPQRRFCSGYAPWVNVVHTRAGLACRADDLLRSAAKQATPPTRQRPRDGVCPERILSPASGSPSGITAAQAIAIYQTWMRRWRIAERFASPDWSIVDLWVAQALLAQAMSPEQVQDILRLASPQFPRRHTNPEDYLRRTLARALLFPPQGGMCVSAPATQRFRVIDS
jgi:hypothetical protein